jgi:hypothetical protein
VYQSEKVIDDYLSMSGSNIIEVLIGVSNNPVPSKKQIDKVPLISTLISDLKKLPTKVEESELFE